MEDWVLERSVFEGLRRTVSDSKKPLCLVTSLDMMLHYKPNSTAESTAITNRAVLPRVVQ